MGLLLLVICLAVMLFVVVKLMAVLAAIVAIVVGGTMLIVRGERLVRHHIFPQKIGLRAGRPRNTPIATLNPI